MEELIQRIMVIEDYGKAITKEAYRDRGNMENDIQEEIEKYKLILQQTEQKNQMELFELAKEYSKKEIESAKEKFVSTINLIDEKYNKNKESWEKEVFYSIIH